MAAQSQTIATDYLALYKAVPKQPWNTGRLGDAIYVDKTLFTKIGGKLDLACGPGFGMRPAKGSEAL